MYQADIYHTSTQYNMSCLCFIYTRKYIHTVHTVYYVKFRFYMYNIHKLNKYRTYIHTYRLICQMLGLYMHIYVHKIYIKSIHTVHTYSILCQILALHIIHKLTQCHIVHTYIQSNMSNFKVYTQIHTVHITM